VAIPELNNLELKGSIQFVNPKVNPSSRINLIRIIIPNTDNRLHPGMTAYVHVKNRQHNSLTLPGDAVLRNGKTALVWVKTGGHSYKVKMVQTGMETGSNV